ncbi:MAG TPA: hypothetical protein VHE78_18890 [Gemmatimonadaceae bacterium]|nr:hypothetical protein [Gemmatimonadaceae bacterium]
MSHLTSERLAALSDDTPSPMEAAHITTCDDCCGELAAQRKLLRMAAAAQVVPATPISSFDALAPRLRAEGLIAARNRGAVARTWTVRLAAGLVLMGGGVVAGRATATTVLPILPKPEGAASGTAAAGVPSPAGEFKTTDDALKALSSAQQTYQTAAAFLAAQDTSGHFVGLNQNTYRTRLTALDEIAAATRAALYQAPQDPVLNQYYLGTLTEREATLTQLKQSMPAASKFRRY